MKNLFVPYELALKLKEKGFDERCFNYYKENGMLHEVDVYHPKMMVRTECVAPLYQQVVDWFREEHGYHIEVEIGTQEFSYFIYNILKDRKETGTETVYFNGSYYQALIKATEESLKLIK